ncbi:TPA: MraY family glycosyltransferase [Legionella pneumophila]
MDLNFILGIKTALITFIAINVLQVLAPHLSLFDYPKGRKNHSAPTPLIGGISIFIGLSYSFFFNIINNIEFSILWISTAIILIIGIIDDVWTVSVKSRLIVHTLAILMFIYPGHVNLNYMGNLLSDTPIYLNQFSTLITLFLALSFINAINMLDGIDGLAGTIIAGQGILLLGICLIIGDFMIANLLLCLLFALLVFLLYNIPSYWNKSSRIFLGDAGSTILALILAWVAISLIQKSAQSPIEPIVIMWCVLYPFMEIYSVCYLRFRKNLPIMAPSHDHIHFLLLRKGFSNHTTLLIVFSLSLFYGLFGFLMHWFEIADNLQFLLMGVFSVLYSLIIMKLDSSQLLIGQKIEKLI